MLWCWARKGENLFARLEGGGSRTRPYKFTDKGGDLKAAQTRTTARALTAEALRALRKAGERQELVGWDWSWRSWRVAFGVVGGAEENNYYGEIHPDHYADCGGQAAVN